MKNSIGFRIIGDSPTGSAVCKRTDEGLGRQWQPMLQQPWLQMEAFGYWGEPGKCRLQEKNLHFVWKTGRWDLGPPWQRSPEKLFNGQEQLLKAQELFIPVYQENRQA